MVHSILISDQAERNVERLADLTGGFKTFSDGNLSAGFTDFFRLLINSAIDGTKILITL